LPGYRAFAALMNWAAPKSLYHSAQEVVALIRRMGSFF
jgi:hypothetical protein